MEKEKLNVWHWLKRYPRNNLVLLLLIINTSTILSQHPAIVNKEAADILLSLSNNQKVDNEITILHSVLNSFERNDLDKEYQTTAESFDSLKKHLTDFEDELENITSDSALVLFNQWYLHFNNTFYNYFKQEFLSSQKQKILFFSTSMSCYCTLEMCKNQTIDIINFIDENNDQYDYWIVDSFEHNELQIEHSTLFAPSVIVFDENNEVLYKIEYEEKMLAQLTDYLINNIH